MEHALPLIIAAVLFLVHNGRPAVSLSTSGTVASPATKTRTKNDIASLVDNENTVRPLVQNWWPVTLVDAVHRDRPNPIEVLSKKLVLFHDGEQWTCLEDRCCHRFAPLSEGRVVEGKQSEGSEGYPRQLQCAYHGWEFRGDGTLASCPQAMVLPTPSSPTSSRHCGVASYPVRVDGEMIWVWTDSNTDTFPTAHQTKLPISPLMREFLKDYPSTVYMRDLPYGYEILGENLMDIAHLPFSHHGTAGFNRDLARPLHFSLMSPEERLLEAQTERRIDPDYNEEHYDEEDCVLTPIFAARISNASQSDPTLVLMTKNGRSVPTNASSSSAFYAPSHVRSCINSGHGQRGNIELFLCPTTVGRSRVFLLTSFERFLKRSMRWGAADKPGFIGRWRKRLPNMLIQSFLKASHRRHLSTHEIFDGDSVFLRKQGERMDMGALTHHDYYTPTTSDVLVRAFRRWLSKAPDSETIVPRGSYYNTQNSLSMERSLMLDRYETHTKHCKLCLQALSRLEGWSVILNRCRVVILSALGGAIGVSSVAIATSPVGGGGSGSGSVPLGRLVQGVAKLNIRSFVVVTSIAMVLFSIEWMNKRIKNRIQKFYLVDYVHSERS